MSYQEIFKEDPKVTAIAPGRVNLLGEHTDYNDGFVLPTAIPQQTTVSLGFSPDENHHFYSQEISKTITYTPSDSIPQGFASYIIGCIELFNQFYQQETSKTIPTLNVYVTSTVPMGSGLSSSAALEVAMLRALRELFPCNLTDIQIAQLGQKAEQQYAKVQCGIMDQMASSLADTTSLLFLDTRTLETQLLPLPENTEIVIIDSGIPRTLAGSGYNQRRAECEAAAKQLGVLALRDIQEVTAIASLPPPIQQRARHVITENNRVLEARSGVSPQRFGELMNASHASLRDDYEVSVAGLDALVDILQKTSGVFGARLTGAGFGGACVALVEAGKGEAIAQTALDQYKQTGYQGKILVPV